MNILNFIEILFSHLFNPTIVSSSLFISELISLISFSWLYASPSIPSMDENVSAANWVITEEHKIKQKILMLLILRKVLEQ